MSRFKDRLWSELVREHGADLAQMSAPAGIPGNRRRMLAGTGLGVVAAGISAALVLVTAGTGPAFAVTRNHDGSVSVVITRMAGISGANAKLAALGYRARLVQVTAACGPPPPGWRLGRQVPAPAGAIPRRFATARFRPRQLHMARFDPRRIPTGRFLVIRAWRRGGTITMAPTRLVPGRPPACLPPPGPPAQFRATCCPGTAPLPNGGPFRHVLPVLPCANRRYLPPGYQRPARRRH